MCLVAITIGQLTVTAAAVCLERRRSLGVLGEEVRTHNPTSSWTSLVEGNGKNPVSAVCSYALLPAWHYAAVPRRDPSSCRRRRRTLAPPVCFHVNSGRAVNATLYTRRPHLPGGCCPCLERPAVISQGSSHHAAVPPRTQEDIVSDDDRWQTFRCLVWLVTLLIL